MRRKRHPVDTQHRAGYRMHLVRDPLDIVNGAEDITRVGTSDQLRLLAE